MTTIHAQRLGDQVLLSNNELEQLLDLARKSDAVEIEWGDSQVTTSDIMRLAQKGGSFDFWSEPGEAIYSGNEGEPLS